MIERLKTLVAEHEQKAKVLGDQLVVSGVNFLVGVLLARLLGVESYGVFVFAWMAILFASGIQQAFIVAPLYALLARKADKRSWINGLFSIQVLFSIISIALVLLGSTALLYFNPERNLPGLSLALSILVGVYLLNDFLRRANFVRLQPGKVLVMDLLGYGLQPLLIAGLFAADVLSVVTAILAVLLAQVCSLIIALRASQLHIDLEAMPEQLMELWQYSRYLLGTSILQWFSGSYFVLAAGAMLGPAVVGAVRMAQNIMGLLHVLFLAMENIVPAKASEILHRDGMPSMVDYMQRISWRASLPTGLLLGAIALFHKPLIAAVYGVEYLPFAPVLLAFCGIYMLVFIGTMLRFAIRTMERNQLIFWGYVLTTVFSLLAANTIVSSMGQLGVVTGIAATHVITLTLYFYALKTNLKWNFK